ADRIPQGACAFHLDLRDARMRIAPAVWSTLLKGSKITPLCMSALPQKRTKGRPPRLVRFVPKPAVSRCSNARKAELFNHLVGGGEQRRRYRQPSAFAAFRLMTSSNLVDCMMGPKARMGEKPCGIVQAGDRHNSADLRRASRFGHFDDPDPAAQSQTRHGGTSIRLGARLCHLAARLAHSSGRGIRHQPRVAKNRAELIALAETSNSRLGSIVMHAPDLAALADSRADAL